MKTYLLSAMVGGWFVGNFEPAVINSLDFEASVKHYQKGDTEQLHHHKIATEITVISSGVVRMCGQIWNSGTIVVIEPGEATDFECLEDATTFVIKFPSVIGDKYLGVLDNS